MKRRRFLRMTAAIGIPFSAGCVSHCGPGSDPVGSFQERRAVGESAAIRGKVEKRLPDEATRRRVPLLNRPLVFTLDDTTGVALIIPHSTHLDTVTQLDVTACLRVEGTIAPRSQKALAYTLRETRIPVAQVLFTLETSDVLHDVDAIVYQATWA